MIVLVLVGVPVVAIVLMAVRNRVLESNTMLVLLSKTVSLKVIPYWYYFHKRVSEYGNEVESAKLSKLNRTQYEPLTKYTNDR